MKVSKKGAAVAALCSFLLAFFLGMLFPLSANAEGFNELYERQEETMEINENAGSAQCDHACLIISGFIGVGGLANAVISLFFLIYGCKKEEQVKKAISVMRQSAERIEHLREKYPPGTRIQMIHMEAPNPVEYGEIGCVKQVDELGVLHTAWESGRTVGVIPTLDRFNIVKENKKKGG